MNPEFKRNLWLEFSWHRLVAMPIVLGLIFLGVALGAQEEARPRLASTALALFLGLTGLWGTRRAAATVAEEFRTRTWDSQRLSALDPWAMTWGKLLGSTSFAWYGALLCLSVVVAVWPSEWPQPLPTVLGLAFCLALGFQALALLMSLMATRKELTRSATRGPWLAALLLGFFGLMRGTMSFPTTTHSITWWGRDTEMWGFVLWSTGVLAAWAILGAYRLMCQELQVRRLPWAWVAFVLYLTWYLTGFVQHVSLPEARAVFALLGLAIALVGTYLLVFSEQTNAMVVQRIWVRVQRREWRRALEEMPCWPMSLLLAVVFCGLLLLNAHHLKSLIKWQEFGFPLLPLLGLLLCIRDVAIFQFFAYARVPRRVEAATLFYLLLLYLILPLVSRAIGADWLGMLILPFPWTRTASYALVVLLVHVAIACGLVVYRWRQTFQES